MPVPCGVSFSQPEAADLLAMLGHGMQCDRCGYLSATAK
jgi:hypothetical protein